LRHIRRVTIRDLGFSVGDEIRSRFKILEIKKGGMGLVFLCEDRYADMPVALKTFQFQHCQDWRKLSRGFQKEADIWIQIGRQYHVVRAYEVFNLKTDEGLWPFLVTELVEGEPRYGASLSGWIEHNALDLRLILLFAHEICLGMTEMQMATVREETVTNKQEEKVQATSVEQHAQQDRRCQLHIFFTSQN
jgi:serine/threonine protein kinase